MCCDISTPPHDRGKLLALDTPRIGFLCIYFVPYIKLRDELYDSNNMLFSPQKVICCLQELISRMQ